jgi:capsid protein
MKFSFEIARSIAGKSDRSKTGAVIRSATIQPTDANVLRTVSDRVTRMYAAASTNSLNGDFYNTIGSANAEILTSLYIMRARSRTLVKDNPYAKGIIRAKRNNVVGHDPFRLEMKVGKKDVDGKFTPEAEINDKIEAWWEKAGRKENCTVRKDMSRLEMYHAAIASVVRDGSILARHHRMFPNNKMGYALELIDSDRLQESYMGRSVRGNNRTSACPSLIPRFNGCIASTSSTLPTSRRQSCLRRKAFGLNATCRPQAITS